MHTDDRQGLDRRAVLGLAAGVAAAAGAVKAAPAKPGDIVAMGARDLSRAIGARRVSCVEVMGAYLDHIERVNPKVNAIVGLQPRAGLLAQAAERDAVLKRGEAVSPLFGFPHAV